jgi:kelch-like protein 20
MRTSTRSRSPFCFRLPLLLAGLLAGSFAAPAQWTTSQLSQARWQIGAGSWGNNVYFAGGSTSGLFTPTDVIDVYNTTTNAWSTLQLSEPRSQVGVASVAGKVLFAGGFRVSEQSDRVDIYNTATQTWTTAQLSVARSGVAAGSAGGKAVFAGGLPIGAAEETDAVDIYDAATNTWSTAQLSQARAGLVAASAGGRVFFGGGGIISTAGISNVVDIYDAATNTWSTSQLSEARTGLVATSAGGKVFFAGGVNGPFSYSTRVDIYDTATNTWSTANLSVGRTVLAATSVGGKVLFAGGFNISSGAVDVVDVYDLLTNTWSTAQLSQARDRLAAASAGDKALFAGGSPNGPGFSNVVDIFTPVNDFSSVPTLTGVPLCAGQSALLDFTVNGMINASFTAQLSDASGSFASPVSLGVVAPGLQSVTIPGNTPPGTGYRVRIVSQNPALTSVPSEPFAVRSAVVTQDLTAPDPVCAGSEVSLVVNATGTGLAYQWYKDAVCPQNALVGEQNDTLKLANAQSFDSGTYYVVVTDACGFTSQESAVVTVNPNPSLSSATASPNPVCAGSPLMLSASASGGTGTLAYAWTGPGNYQASGASVQRTAAAGVEGVYAVTVTDENTCQATGQTAAVALKIPVSVQGITPPQTVCWGENVSFTVEATGTGVSVQWYKTSVSPQNKLTNQTNPTLSLTAVQATDGGTYVAEVKDECGNTLTPSTSLVVNHPVLGVPTVAGAPVCAGQAVTLSFAVTVCNAGGYVAQLSDGSGSFANPVSLGSIAPGANQVVIPQNTPFGLGYRFRIVSSGPSLTSAPSEPFRVNALGNPTVALYPATPGAICLGDVLPVTFSTTGTCPFPVGNVFTVELSSATGSFAAPLVLGVAQPGTTSFPASLLSGLSAGTGYRVRILSSNPVQTSFASAPFELRYPSIANVTPGVGGVPQGGLCRGNSVTVSFTLPANACAFPDGNAFTAQLSSASGSFANPVNLGVVQAGVPNSLTIPANSAAGTGYRIRVVSSQPTSTSLASTPFRVNACVSRLSAEEPDLVVMPNPVQGSKIRLRVSGMDSPQFSLTTSAGRSVNISVKTDGSGEFVLVPVQSLAAGVYAVTAGDGSTRLTRRVLVTE